WQMLMEINIRNPILSKPLVREAIAHAIDKTFIATTVYSGFAEPATGPLPKSLTKFYTGDVPIYKFDPKLSQKLLDEAGYPEKNGKRFAVRLTILPTFAENQRAGQYVQQALGDVGIEAVIDTPDMAGFVQKVYCNNDFDLTIGNAVS